MKKNTMLALFASALEFASLNAMMEVPNGFLGMKRDIILRLLEIMKNDDRKVRAVFGMGQEILPYGNHYFFLEVRWGVYPKPNDIQEVNKKVEEHFATLDGGYEDGFSSLGMSVGQICSLELEYLLFRNQNLDDWKSENQDKADIAKNMSFDAYLDKCNSPGFKVLDPQEQAFYKEEFFRRLVIDDFQGQITVDNFQKLPYDIFLLLAICHDAIEKDATDHYKTFNVAEKYARFFSKNQFQRMPKTLIEKGDLQTIRTLYYHKNKLPKRLIEALGERLDTLKNLYDVVSDERRSAINPDFEIFSEGCLCHFSDMISDIRKLRKELNNN
ncbi:hypothetical protein FACS189449_02060 [Alphaproteobacteria bacterium]|nr:hypothetical protein FACS189449_02060 [Alphaproteobacteria bacterium]